MGNVTMNVIALREWTRCRAYLIAAAICLLSLCRECSAQQSAQPGARLTFPAGLSYRLIERNDELSVRIPVGLTVGAPANAQLRLQLRDVADAEDRAVALLSGLSVKLLDETPTTGPSIEIVARAAELPPGKYTVVLEVFTDDTPATRQSVALTLERPAASVTPDRTVRVWQVRGACSSSFTAGRLILTNGDKHTAVRELTAAVMPDVPSTADAETGTLRVDISTLPLPAEKTLEFLVTPIDDFPLGKTTGKLRLQSPQFSAPIIVTYEVYARRTQWLIPLCAALGSIAGWLLRVHLQQKRETIKALTEASAALDELNQVRDRTLDTVVRRSIEKAELELKRATGKRKVATEISEAIKTARKAVEEARADLEKRRREFIAKFDSQLKTARTRFVIPDEVETVVQDLRDAGDRIEKLVADENIAAADSLFEGTFAQTVEATVRAARRWRAATFAEIHSLISYLPALAGANRQSLETSGRAWLTDNDDSTGPDPTSFEPPALQTELNRTHEQFHKAKRWKANLRDATRQFAFDFRKALKLVATSHPDIELRSFLDRRYQELVEGPNDPGLAKEACETERRLWIEAIAATGNDQAIQKLVRAGEWDEALEAAKTVNRSATMLGTGAHQVLGDDPQRPFGANFAETTAAPPPRPPVSSTTAGEPAAASQLSGSVEERNRFEQEDRAAMLLQTAILGAIFMALSLVIYGDRWVGTFSEMFGIFAWGFGVDLTINTLGPLMSKTIPVRP